MRVALTFDAEHPDRPGSNEETVNVILRLLAEAGARSTFFLQGRWAQAHPVAARRIVEDGHLIGSHSHFHARMPLLTDEGLRADVVQAGRAIREATGTDPRPWFRCPWGHGARDARVLQALRRQRYVHVGWDVVAEDWEPSRTPDHLVRDVVAGIRGHGAGAIVLMHAWPSSTGHALSGILSELGPVSFVTVAELSPGGVESTANPETAAQNPA